MRSWKPTLIFFYHHFLCFLFYYFCYFYCFYYFVPYFLEFLNFLLKLFFFSLFIKDFFKLSSQSLKLSLLSYFLINVEIRGPLSSESLNNIIGNGILSYPKPVSKVILALNSSSSISNCFLITVLFMISFASKSVVVC